MINNGIGLSHVPAENYISLERKEVVLVWKDFAFKTNHMFMFATFFAGIVTAFASLGALGTSILALYFMGTFIATMLAFYLFRWASHTIGATYPLVMNVREIVAPGVVFAHRTTWSDVTHIECFPSLIGYGVAPIEFNLMLYRSSGRPQRVLIPNLPEAEHKQFLEVLQSIADHHGLKLEFK